MSRNRVFLTIVALIVIQNPASAKAKAHHTVAAKPMAPIAAKASTSMAPTTASSPYSKTDTASRTVVRTESRLIPYDMDNVTAPEGALYTTSDDCG